MSRSDWLVGRDRREQASERIVNAAAELVARGGFSAFTIEALAAGVHCSPATIYRNVGGKKVIMERVLSQMSLRIVDEVFASVDGLQGSERIVAAVESVLHQLRAEPLGPVIIGAIRPAEDTGWLKASPLVEDLAERMVGYRDPLVAQWLVRATLALWYWPVGDPRVEHEIISRFIGPNITTFQVTAAGEDRPEL